MQQGLHSSPSFAETRIPPPDVAILTGGGDRPYALGLAAAIAELGLRFDFIASDDLRSPLFENNPLARFLNYRGDQNPTVPVIAKITRLLKYYVRLICYSATSRAPIFHLLWNNKFETFDRTLLTLFYKLIGKRLVLTAHNINIAKRDGSDSWLNRATLKCQYWLVDHIFVHTEQMRLELRGDFGVSDRKVSVIPFGINSSVPVTTTSREEARRRLALDPTAKTLLFFGNIAPYKGLEYLIEAVAILAKLGHRYRVIVAGRPKGAESYWERIRARIVTLNLDDCVIQRIEYVPDDETEIYFKAADVFVLPYTHVFQSGVLFLGYNFGLPVIASDVGSLSEEIVPGETGFVCAPQDSEQLAVCIQRYFSSNLYFSLATNRAKIRAYAHQRYSWATVGAITRKIYRTVLSSEEPEKSLASGATPKEKKEVC